MNHSVATRTNNRRGLSSLELFVGAGGLALGMASAGIHHEAVLDWDKDACRTIRENQSREHPLADGWKVLQADVVKFDFARNFPTVDIVSGGPPCQPFSLGGRHRGNCDHRDMFPTAVRAIRELTPRAFIFENVRGLLRKSFSSYFGYILLQLGYPELVQRTAEPWIDHLSRLEKYHTKGVQKGLHYRTVYRLLNAADFGVPQKRERVFIVGFRNDLKREWSFPKNTHSRDSLLHAKWVTGDYWDMLKVPTVKRPQLPTSDRTRVERLKANYSLFPPELDRWHTVRDALKGLPDPYKGQRGGKFSNHMIREGARSYPGHTGSTWDDPAKTLKAGGHGVPGGENMLRDYDGNLRYFTVRESARLQTFPDDWIFTGSWTECMRQIGNAVPVRLARVVADSVSTQALAL